MRTFLHLLCNYRSAANEKNTRERRNTRDSVALPHGLPGARRELKVASFTDTIPECRANRKVMLTRADRDPGNIASHREAGEVDRRVACGACAGKTIAIWKKG